MVKVAITGRTPSQDGLQGSSQAPNRCIQSENSQGTRIGDKIKVKGLAFKGMLELKEMYSDVTFRIMFIGSAKGDFPNSSTMFQGVSGNKMLDHFNNERFTLLSQKWIKIKAANLGTSSSGTPMPTSGATGTG